MKRNHIKQSEKATRKYISQSEKDVLLKASLAIIAEEDGQVTLRHLFYRLVGGLHPR